MGSSALEDLGPAQYLALNWAMWTLGFIIVVLRLAVRYRTTGRLYWDDFFAIFGMMWLTTMVIVIHLERDAIYLQVDLATTGRPSNPKFTSQQQMTDAIVTQKKLEFALMVAFWNCLWSVKASLLMFYRRLFAGVNGYMRWWWVVVASCMVAWLISLLTTFLVCLPLSRRFSLDPQELCSAKPAINAIYVATSLDIATDILVAVLPISLLVGLRMNLKKKVAIGLIFALGVLIIFFATFRMVKIVGALKAESAKIFLSLVLWSMLEAAVAVMVGSLPTLKALISRRGQTDYTGQTPNGGTYGAQGPSLRLYNMGSQGGVRTKVRGGYGSDEEALNKRGKQGITKTQEVSVSSEDFTERKGESSEFMHGPDRRNVATVI